MPEVPEAAVEAVAKAQYEREPIITGKGTWEDFCAWDRSVKGDYADGFRGRVRADLAVALPAIHADVRGRLLDERAIRAFRDAALSQSAQLKVPAHQLNGEIRDGMNAACDAALPEEAVHA